MTSSRTVISFATSPAPADNDLLERNTRALQNAQADLVRYRESYEAPTQQNPSAASSPPILELHSDHWSPHEILLAGQVAQKINNNFGADGQPDRYQRKLAPEVKLVRSTCTSGKLSRAKTDEYARLGMCGPDGKPWSIDCGALAILLYLDPSHGLLKLIHYSMAKELHSEQQKPADGCHWPARKQHGGVGEFDFHSTDIVDHPVLDEFIAYIKTNPDQHPFVGDWPGGDRDERAQHSEGELNPDARLVTPATLTGLLGSKNNHFSTNKCAMFFMTLIASRCPVENVVEQTVAEVNTGAVGLLPKNWKPGEGRFVKELQKKMLRIVESLNTGRRFVFMGVVCTVANFGIERFRLIDKLTRRKLWADIYSLAPITVTNTMEGDKAAKWVDLVQIFNRKSEYDAEKRAALRVWYATKFTALCEFYYKGCVLGADFRKLSSDVAVEIDDFMAHRWKTWVPTAYRQTLEDMTWKDMPVNILGLSAPRNRGEKRTRASMEDDVVDGDQIDYSSDAQDMGDRVET